MKIVNATWMAGRPQWYLSLIGLTKSVQPYCRLATIDMLMTPRPSCHQRPNAGARASSMGVAAISDIYLSRLSSISDTMNPNAGHPPDLIDVSNHVLAFAFSPRSRYQL